MESRKNVVAATIQNQNSVLKPVDCPLILIKLMSARKIAFEAYPNSPHAQAKIALVEGLKFSARRLLNEHPVNICNRVLALQNDFTRVAPSENSKMRFSYMEKIRAVIEACNSFKSLKNKAHD